MVVHGLDIGTRAGIPAHVAACWTNAIGSGAVVPATRNRRTGPLRGLLGGRDEAKRVLIEAKFAGGLTDNQPVAYLKRLQRLPDGRPAALLFVSPKRRVESLWAELCRRAATSGIALESFRKAGGVWSAAIGDDGPRLLLVSWADLLDRVEARVADSQAEADIRQLRGLADREDRDVFRPVRPEELWPLESTTMTSDTKNVAAIIGTIVATGVTMTTILVTALGGRMTSIENRISNVEAELRTTRTELREEIHATRTELREEIRATRSELREEIRALDTRVRTVETGFTRVSQRLERYGGD